LTTSGNDVYACVLEGDIYRQSNGTGNFIALGQTSRRWTDLTSIGNVIYSSVGPGDIYTAPVYPDNTIKIDSSFTLPEHTVGNRRRILNTHTSAITVTMPSGETLDGAGTYSLAPDAMIEIEKISDTTWATICENGEAVKTIDHTSRILDINGDNLLDIPDGVALYKNDPEWSSWGATNGTTTISNSVVRFTQSGTDSVIPRFALNWENKTLVVRARAFSNINVIVFTNTDGFQDLGVFNLTSEWKYLTIRNDYVGASAELAFFFAASAGSWIEFSDLYIGDGSYTTKLLDRSGTNNLTNYGVTPIDTPRGKGLYFNGSAGLVADNPVLGASGTIAIDFTTGADVTTLQIVYDSGAGNGAGEHRLYITGGSLLLIIGGTANYNEFTLGGLTANTRYVLSYDFLLTAIKRYFNGVKNIDALAYEPNIGDLPLVVGAYVDSVSLTFTGTISRLYYTTDIWTDAEHRAWYLGAETPDCIQYSATPDEGKVMVWGESGYVDFDTPTGTSTGTQGQIKADASYIYICTATNTWKRTALSSF
jgi:hypothetical protein